MRIENLTLVSNGDHDGLVARGAVEAQAIHSRSAGNEGVLAAATGVDGRADALLGASSANIEAWDLHAGSGGNEGRGVPTGPTAVGEVANITLDPGTGELADGGQRNAADAASAADLGVAVDGDGLLATSGQGELQGLVAVEEAVDTAIGSDLVPASALSVAASIVENHGVLVLADEVVLDGHDVASVLTASTNIALISNLGGGSTLAVAALAELGVGRNTGALAARGGVLGRGSGRRSRGGDRSGGRGGSVGGLVGHDEVAAGLHGVVGALVNVAAGVGRDAEGGSQENRGGGELHDVGVCCRSLKMLCI